MLTFEVTIRNNFNLFFGQVKFDFILIQPSISDIVLTTNTFFSLERLLIISYGDM